MIKVATCSCKKRDSFCKIVEVELSVMVISFCGRCTGHGCVCWSVVWPPGAAPVGPSLLLKMNKSLTALLLRNWLGYMPKVYRQEACLTQTHTHTHLLPVWRCCGCNALQATLEGKPDDVRCCDTSMVGGSTISESSSLLWKLLCESKFITCALFANA